MIQIHPIPGARAQF